MPTTIATNLAKIKREIVITAEKYHRLSNTIQLLAVSKMQSIENIRAATLAGQLAFGENYLQEALPKINALQNLPIEWHYIGAIQSNKTRKIAENFAWAHAITNTKVAQRLGEQRPSHLDPLNVCIEVNIDADPNKNGIDLSELSSLAHLISDLPGLKLRGLMTMPALTHDFDQQRAAFHQLKAAFLNLSAQGLAIDTLSMGTSHDFVAAIAEGGTIIRIGTAIFGPRSQN